MRPRELTRFDGKVYDVLVVGGGIYGLACAYEAASRGLRVALVEASDFGSGASFNHQKTAHGGLRSLSTGHLGRARESIRERRALARIAPWFLRPLPFLIGTYRSRVQEPSRRSAQRSKWTHGWDGGATKGSNLNCTCLFRDWCLRPRHFGCFRVFGQDGLTGGAQWYDYQMVEADRLTLSFAAAADRAGADLANYAEAIDVVLDGGKRRRNSGARRVDRSPHRDSRPGHAECRRVQGR